MKNLTKRHYEAVKSRGFILKGTTAHDFIDKLSEEYYEVRNAYADMLSDQLDGKAEDVLTPEFISESVDLAAVVVNMLTHYGYDFETEFRKNVELQESRT